MDQTCSLSRRRGKNFIRMRHTALRPSSLRRAGLTPHECLALHRAGLKNGNQRIHQGVGFGRMVAAKIAHVHIQRHRALLGPSVNAQVRLGQQHSGSHPARPQRCRRKTVKQLGYGLQARSPYGAHAMLAQAGGIGQTRRVALALVQVRCQMKSLHGWYFRALLSPLERPPLAR